MVAILLLKIGIQSSGEILQDNISVEYFKHVQFFICLKKDRKIV